MYSETLALRAGKITDGRSSRLWGTGGRRSPARPAETAGDDRRFPGRQDRLVARGSPACQSRDVLLEALAECASDLGRHSSGVGRLAEAAADRLGLERDQREEVRLAGELHDVGKLAIPDGILNKPGRLTREERVVAEMHSVIGERILAAAPALANVARLVRWSHEWEDGTGYPDRLAGEEIPLGSRVVPSATPTTRWSPIGPIEARSLPRRRSPSFVARRDLSSTRRSSSWSATRSSKPGRGRLGSGARPRGVARP